MRRGSFNYGKAPMAHGSLAGDKLRTMVLYHTPPRIARKIFVPFSFSIVEKTFVEVTKRQVKTIYR